MPYRLGMPIYLILFVVSGCEASTSPNKTTSGSSTTSCREISIQNKAALVAGVAKLQIGDSQAAAESLLGKPGDVGHLATKPSSRIMGTEYIYYVRKCGSSPHVGWNDDYILLMFRLNDRLGRIEAVRVRGVVNRSDEQHANVHP